MTICGGGGGTSPLASVRCSASSRQHGTPLKTCCNLISLQVVYRMQGRALVPSVIPAPFCDDLNFFKNVREILPKVTLGILGAREALYSLKYMLSCCKLILTFLLFCHYFSTLTCNS